MTDLNKIAFVGSYVPRQCGIATFSKDLRDNIQAALSDSQCFVVPVSTATPAIDYPDEARFEIAEGDIASYRRAADYLNYANVDVLSVQHEFGIFGGPAGSHVLALMRRVRVPIVTTLHTVVAHPSSEQRQVMHEIVSLSSRLVVMSSHGRDLLRATYGVAASKVETIHHGIPDIPWADRQEMKRECGLADRHVLLTFGLLSPNKGIEQVIQALPRVVSEFPDALYVVVGATHPNLRRTEGERYRESLAQLADHMGVGANVVFVNRYVDLTSLARYLRAADVYLTPYLSEMQSSSGTLAYALGCGNAVVSTPYWHAAELLGDGRGLLVPFADSAAIGHEVCRLLSDDEGRAAIQRNAYAFGRRMVWREVALRYNDVFRAARRSRSERKFTVLPGRGLQEARRKALYPRLEHLIRLTDSTGLFQHASFATPRYADGYCTDDNARALILTSSLERNGLDPRIDRLESTYASFVNHAFDPASRRFRNFMGFDRKWLEPIGAEDSQGRALWALGTCVGRSRRPELRSWAVALFGEALPGLLETRSPRAWAFGLLGLVEYLRHLAGDRRAAKARDEIEGRLVMAYLACNRARSAPEAGAPTWRWFEDVLAYDNAKLPHALVASGRNGGEPLALEIGLGALRWLVGVQTSERGHLRPIGSSGFYRRGGVRTLFDQQPIDAHSTLSACKEAYGATADPFWLIESRRAFDWFIGHNDLGLPLFDASGGCRDGLLVDRVNQNQGAESTLSFLLAAAELRQLEAAAGAPGLAAYV